MRTILTTTLVYTVWAASTLSVAVAADVAQKQQKFPSMPIRLVVASSAGTPPDTVARMMGEKMSASWGRAVVVDNRPGAGGMLAGSAVAKAAPDGHTLLWSNGFSITAATQPNLPYDPLKDFAGVAQIGYGSPGVLVVGPDLGVKSVAELIALAKSQPGKIIFGSAAAGSGVHLTGARFIRAAGIKVISVAFKGSPEATIEVLAGRTHYTIGPLATVLPFIKDGKLLALAVLRHSPLLPGVPALAETMPEFKRTENSLGLLAPAGTPRPILNQISKEVARILDMPDIRERLSAIGVVPAPTTPEEYGKIVREQIEVLTKVIADLGVKAK
jgi:tripartite-type tricarboxylate transporter receptor subunit TctC